MYRFFLCRYLMPRYFSILLKSTSRQGFNRQARVLPHCANERLPLLRAGAGNALRAGHAVWLQTIHPPCWQGPLWRIAFVPLGLRHGADLLGGVAGRADSRSCSELARSRRLQAHSQQDGCRDDLDHHGAGYLVYAPLVSTGLVGVPLGCATYCVPHRK